MEIEYGYWNHSCKYNGYYFFHWRKLMAEKKSVTEVKSRILLDAIQKLNSELANKLMRTRDGMQPMTKKDLFKKSDRPNDTERL